MPILTTNQPNSGDPVSVQIDKEEIKLIPKVSSDSSFSSDSSWSLVTAVFKHTTSNRRFYTVLRNFSETEVMPLKPQMAGGDNFEINKLLISKSDRSHLVVKRSEIPNSSNYDFSLKAVASYAWQHDFANGLLVQQTPVYPFVGELISGKYMMHKDAGQQGVASFIPRIEWTTGSVNPVSLNATKNHKFRVYVSEVSVGSLSGHSFVLSSGGYGVLGSITGTDAQTQFSQSGYFEIPLPSQNVAIFSNDGISFTIGSPANGPEITFKVSKLEIYEV